MFFASFILLLSLSFVTDKANEMEKWVHAILVEIF